MVRLHDADQWLFRGFSGAIKLLQRRGNDHKNVPVAPKALEQLVCAAEKLEAIIRDLSRLPIGEAAIEEIDHELAEGIVFLTGMVRARLIGSYYPRNQSVKAVDMLQDELQRLHRLIAGLQELNRRHDAATAS